MAYMWQLRITCGASGCIEGFTDVTTGAYPETMRVDLWEKREAQGWTYQAGMHLCPKHLDYAAKLAACGKVDPVAVSDLEERTGR